MNFQIAKGVFDILPKDPDPEGKWRESFLWQYVEKEAREAASLYGFQEIRTPLFEKTELFQRSVGSTSDIVVKKEMYTFEDKGQRSLTLRPEGTAAVLRAFIEKKLDQQLPIQKFYYIQPMFRYERQQAGRYRQHHQFGVEAIGSDSPYQDVEVIALLFAFLQSIQMKDLTLHLNSLGEKETRDQYGKALKEFLSSHYNHLSSESQERFHTNPLRILDSKAEEDKKILEKAPSLLHFLEGSAKDHFEMVCALLQESNIPYVINPKLVRGLDYYSHTVFEITAQELGAQNSLGGGGRYDGLIKELGGPNLPSIGFGAGLERIIQTLLAQKCPLPSFPAPLLFIIPIGEKAKKRSFTLLASLRKEKLTVEMELSDRKLKNSMRLADSLKAHYVIVIGDTELDCEMAELKEMTTGHVEKIAFSSLAEKLKQSIYIVD